MRRKPTQAQIFNALLSKYERSTAEAFMAAINDLRSSAEMAKVTQAISNNDFYALITALHLDPAVFHPLSEAIRQSYMAGGTFGAAAITGTVTPAGTRLIFRFDGVNPRAEAWLKQQSSTLITRIIDDQRLAVRSALEAGMGAGQNPTRTALDIVGRVNRATGRREGGILGLSTPQAEYVANARAELLSGDTASLQNYLMRTRRDMRFDGLVDRAMNDGTPIAQADVDKMVGRYSDRLLQTRGEAIAKQETFASLESSRQEAYNQIVDTGQVQQSAVKKKWRHFPNNDPRPDHVEMNGKTVGMNEMFVLPDGTRMQFPHDPSAPVKNVINCHCMADFGIDFLGGL